MGAYDLAARIGADPAVELGVPAQAGQAQGHVRRGAAGDVNRFGSGVDNDVDEGLTDNEGGSFAAGGGSGHSWLLVLVGWG